VVTGSVSYDDGGNGQVFGSNQGTRNMLSLRDNLNATDLVNKVITFTFDGRTEAVVKPTSNGETSSRQSRAEPVRKSRKGVETCAKPQQMALAA
jgi:hypothetical protein